MNAAQHYQAPAQLLKDRIILITGAGAGIGRSAALSFAHHGATVILLGKTIAKLEAVYDEIEQAGYPQPAIYPLDLKGATMGDYQDMHDSLAQNFGRLDGLLHNASVLGDRKPIAQSNVDIWQEVMQVNVNAEFMLTKALLPLLEASDSAYFHLIGCGATRPRLLGPLCGIQICHHGFDASAGRRAGQHQ